MDGHEFVQVNLSRYQAFLTMEGEKQAMTIAHENEIQLYQKLIFDILSVLGTKPANGDPDLGYGVHMYNTHKNSTYQLADKFINNRISFSKKSNGATGKT